MKPIEPFLIRPENRDILEGEPFRTEAARRGRTGLWVAVCVEVWVLLGVVYGAGELLTWWRLQRFGTRTTATVTELHIIDGGEAPDDYYVTYEVQLDGKKVDGSRREQHIYRNYFRQLKVGTTLPVLFLRESPNVSRLIEDDEWIEGAYFWLFIGLVSVVPFVWFVRWHRNKVRLVQDGAVLEGKLLLCHGKQDPGSDFHIEVIFGFRSPQGRLLDGKASAVRNDLKGNPLPEADTKVAVLYLNDHTYQVL